MDLGPAHSFSQGMTRIAILLILIPGFFVTFGVGMWMGDKWFGGFHVGNRWAATPVWLLFMIYGVIAIVLVQFW
jgi:hypothetical protein